MKKILVAAVAVTMVLMAGSAFATIQGTKHDLTEGSATTVGYTAATVNISACAFCHTPHNAQTGSTAPLWNRTTAASYVPYSNSTTSFSSRTVTIGSASKTCLSCHDGTVAIGDVAVGDDAQGTATIIAITDRVGSDGKLSANNLATIGTNLSNDHPVGFVVNESSTTAGLGSIANMKSKGARFYVSDTTMECGTCHDPHDNSKGNFLRLNAASICTDCHSTK